MNDNWKSYSSAPAGGTVVCAASEVPEGRAHCVELGDFPILLARTESGVFAYVNACPHQFLPLDYRGGSVVSSNGRVLICSNHEAGFDLATGAGISGFGTGCALDPVPTKEDEHGQLVIDD